MAKKRDQLSPEASTDRYFHVMLNMSDDDLNPYQYRLLGHYIRVGKCWESVRTTAKHTKMSVGMVVRSREELAAMGYISVQPRADDTHLITVKDRMAENVARYSKCSPYEQDVHHMNTGVHTMNQRKNHIEERTKEETKDSAAPAAAAVSDNLPPSKDVEREGEKPSSPPVPPPSSPPVFRAVAKWAFGIADDAVIDGIWNTDPRTAKRIKIVSAWLAKKHQIKDVAGEEAESVVARMREAQAWRKTDPEYQKLSVPKDGAKFGEMWAKFESAQAARGVNADGAAASGAVSTGLGDALSRKATQQ